MLKYCVCTIYISQHTQTSAHTDDRRGVFIVWKKALCLPLFNFQPNQPWHQQTHHQCFHDNSFIMVRVHIHTDVIPVPLWCLFISLEKRSWAPITMDSHVLGRKNISKHEKKKSDFPSHLSCADVPPLGCADRKWEWLLPACVSFEAKLRGTMSRRSNVPVLSPGSL